MVIFYMSGQINILLFQVLLLILRIRSQLDAQPTVCPSLQCLGAMEAVEALEELSE